jgi:hypothetical protein
VGLETAAQFVRGAAPARRACPRFTPDAPDAGDRWRDLPIEYQEEALRTRISWYARVLAAHCTGPIVEIYRLVP